MGGKKQTFEQALNRLEDIVSEMEDNGTSLEDCVKLYKEGIALSLFCSERLNSIEQEVTILQKSAEEGFFRKPFVIE